MIIDERTYKVIPGKMKAYLDYYEKNAKHVQWPIVGEPIGFFVTEIGTLNQVVHWWRYDSLADREAKRAKLATQPGWGDFLAGLSEFLLEMENRILTPVSFSPMK